MGGNPVDDLLFNCFVNPSELAINQYVDQIEKVGVIKEGTTFLLEGRLFVIKGYDINRAMAIIQEENLDDDWQKASYGNK